MHQPHHRSRRTSNTPALEALAEVPQTVQPCVEVWILQSPTPLQSQTEVWILQGLTLTCGMMHLLRPTTDQEVGRTLIVCIQHHLEMEHQHLEFEDSTGMSHTPAGPALFGERLCF